MTQLTTKTAQRLKTLKTIPKVIGDGSIEEIISFKNELKDDFESYNDWEYNRDHALIILRTIKHKIQEIESVEK